MTLLCWHSVAEDGSSIHFKGSHAWKVPGNEFSPGNLSARSLIVPVFAGQWDQM